MFPVVLVEIMAGVQQPGLSGGLAGKIYFGIRRIKGVIADLHGLAAQFGIHFVLRAMQGDAASLVHFAGFLHKELTAQFTLAIRQRLHRETGQSVQGSFLGGSMHPDMVESLQPCRKSSVQIIKRLEVALLDFFQDTWLETAVDKLEKFLNFASAGRLIWSAVGKPYSQPSADLGDVSGTEGGAVVTAIPNSE